jgi:hypothetical protein
MDKRIKNYLLNTARTPVKTRVDIGAPEGYIESNTGKNARHGNLDRLLKVHSCQTIHNYITKLRKTK